MSENKDTDQEKQFADWLSNKTEQDKSQDNDLLNAENEESESLWQERMNTANYLAHHAGITADESVPDWDRSSGFIQEKNTWWQWSGLPAVSLAFSFFAVALVLFKVEFVIQDQGLMVSFGGSNQAIQDEKIAKLVDQKLQTFANEQQLILADYASDIQVKQQDSNLQLASYIMGASRQERKEDITEFINYVNDQRADQQYDQTMKFKQLEQKINYQNTQSGGVLKTKPANWITED